MKASGTAAPEGSRTLPWIEDWAKAARGRSTNTRRRAMRVYDTRKSVGEAIRGLGHRTLSAFPAIVEWPLTSVASGAVDRVLRACCREIRRLRRAYPWILCVSLAASANAQPLE